MADTPKDPPRRTASEKDQSRRQSRPVSGKEAAKAPGSKSARRRQADQKGGSDSRRGDPRGPRGGSRRGGARQPARRQASAGPRRSRTALYTWGAVALVIVIVIALVLVSTTSKPKNVTTDSAAVPATVLTDITQIPTSVFNKVGTGIPGSIAPPKVVNGHPPLRFTGKPGMLAVLGEFCPFCAAERWAIISSFARFGSFSGLRTMQSSTTDEFPATQTFTFATAHYLSPYFTARLIEYYGQDHATGNHFVLKPLSKEEARLVKTYDISSTKTKSGTIPFSDFGNRVFFSGSSYSPGPLQSLSRATIASQLRDPKRTITKLILGTSNYISAAVCSMTNGKPGSVCQSSGVQAAASALKLKF